MSSAAKQGALVPAEEPQFIVPVESGGMLSLFERLATDPNASVEKIERLMALWERGEAKKAEAAFNADMASAQAEMRPVATDSFNPQTKSKYSSYEALDRALRPIYTAHGFGLSFNTGDAPMADYVRVLCDVTHRAGHVKPYKLDMPADGKGAKGGDVMTKTHAAGSALSYAQRYLLKMIFNVATGEGDDDGNAAGRQAKREVTPPNGFQLWWDDLEAVAADGTVALNEAWTKSKPEFRKFLVANSKDAWETLKRKAGTVRP